MMREIWAAGGVGPARLAVMERAKTKTGIFSRWNEKPGGVAFAGLHDGVCMVHAVEVVPSQPAAGRCPLDDAQSSLLGRGPGGQPYGRSLCGGRTRLPTGSIKRWASPKWAVTITVIDLNKGATSWPMICRLPLICR